MEIKELFSEVGLSLNEGKAYSILIEFGKLSAAEISSKSGVPYGRVYSVLDNLVAKGLAQIIPEKTRKFSPTNPDSLMELVEKKKKALEGAEEKIKEFKKFYKKEKNFLVIGEGDKGFWKIADEMKTSEKYSYAVKWDSKIRPDDIEKAKKRIKRGIDLKVLARYDEETKKNVNRWLKAYDTIRKFPNEGIALSIVDDSEVMIGLIKKNTTLLIKDESFAKVMKKLFLGSFNSSPKIE